MSAGLCEVRNDDVAETLLSRVDAALYRAKNAGRNRVMAA
jgi:PleD family two-component response regulator